MKKIEGNYDDVMNFVNILKEQAFKESCNLSLKERLRKINPDADNKKELTPGKTKIPIEIINV